MSIRCKISTCRLERVSAGEFAEVVNDELLQQRRREHSSPLSPPVLPRPARVLDHAPKPRPLLRRDPFVSPSPTTTESIPAARLGNADSIAQCVHPSSWYSCSYPCSYSLRSFSSLFATCKHVLSTHNGPTINSSKDRQGVFEEEGVFEPASDAQELCGS
ncbi:hypothetical protein CNBC1790 [Cryptococcus deneoformans B-3501A]|uniref:hypothetical protein n=1 Tax=Cryptococcus deneoformans (strain B-3501A) TaxID=283643 RepID=UPI000042CFE3|nr:hypothetical protein CNBC1790 [Cryptococcus neoformans var. neoformans B-3501A]EAL22041.1 hypothetical protein CNBC1790 [Cryptococcus neoformans var. neoformans B-3501A]